MALIWLGRFDEATTAVQRALAFRDKIPANLQSFFDVIQAQMINDDTRTALPRLLEIEAQDPYQHDVLYTLGEIYTHSPARGDPRRSAQTYEQLLGLDPALSLVYEHELNAYLRQGRFDLAHARLDAWAGRQALEPRVPAGRGRVVGGPLRRRGASAAPRRSRPTSSATATRPRPCATCSRRTCRPSSTV